MFTAPFASTSTSWTIDSNAQKELFKYSLRVGKCRMHHPLFRARAETSPQEQCDGPGGRLQAARVR
eukprot:10386368-Alexandrium_andersonii.AAC.1